VHYHCVPQSVLIQFTRFCLALSVVSCLLMFIFFAVDGTGSVPELQVSRPNLTCLLFSLTQTSSILISCLNGLLSGKSRVRSLIQMRCLIKPLKVTGAGLLPARYLFLPVAKQNTDKVLQDGGT